MIGEFEEFVSSLVMMTFGFSPKVRTVTNHLGEIEIYLDGTESQRKRMMGHKATTLHAMKHMLIQFSKRHDSRVFLYIEFQDEEDKR